MRQIAAQVEEGIKKNLLQFGRRISITNDYLLVGNSEQSSDQGTWLFGKNTGGTDAWGLLKSFTFPGVNDPSESTADNEQFGFSTSIDGDYIVIGANRSKAYNGSSSITTAGLAFVYYRHQGGIDNWGLQQKIYAQNTDGTHDIVEDARFGNRVNIKGRYLVVSAAERDNGGDLEVGASYIYYRTGNVWSIQQRIMPDVPIAGDKFGASVLSPDTLYCCASAKQGNKAYVFKRTGTTWTQYKILLPQTLVTNSTFGFELEYDGENIIVGAPGTTNSYPANEGRIYIYKQTNTNLDGNGVLSIDNHTTHELYLDGEKQQLSVNYNFKNDSQIQNIENLTNNPIAVTEDSDIITITHTNHGFSVNDNITILDSETINDLPNTFINVSKTISSVIDNHTYTVQLDLPVNNSLLLNYEAWNYSGSGNWLNQVNTGLNPGVIDAGSGITYNSSGVKSFDFVNTNDKRINCGSVDLTTSWTFEVWVKFHNLGTGNEGFLGHGVRSSQQGLQVAVRDSGQTLRYIIPGYTFDATTSSTIQENTWVQLVITYNSTNYVRQVYQNGTLLDSTTGGLSVEYLNNRGDLSIGAGYSSGEIAAEFDGEIAIVRMYTKVLSSSEITTNYNAGYQNEYMYPSSNGNGGGSNVKISRDYPLNTVAEHSIDGWRKIYETGRQFNCILIKGKYLGYGGQIEFRDKENIMENPDGYNVKQVIYTDDNIELPSFKFLIDLEQKQTDFISTFSNERTVPSSSLYKNLNIIESNNLFTNINPIGLGGKVYKLIQDEPVNVDDNFVNLCIKDLGTMENVESNTIDDIFAKILLPSGSGAVHYDTFTTTGKEFYDKPLRELTELEISFVNNKNQLVDFNGYDHSFTLEIIELDEELLKINPTSGMVI